MTFVPLHNHTEYSALDGLSTCEEIAKRCQCIGCNAVGITDHGTIAGHLEFAKTMAKYDIKPIFGCELYHGVKTEFAKQERDQAHFVAGALTNEGLKNLWRLVDASASNFRFVGRVNWDMLEKYNEGLFATSACLSGLVSKGVEHDDTTWLNKYLDIFGDRFYIELHTYPGDHQEDINKGLVALAQERGLPVVYATDAHFASPEDYEVHDAYVAMQTGESILMDPEDRRMWHPKALYIKDEAEIRESLLYLPDHVVQEALDNSSLIADQVNVELPKIRRHLPVFIPSKSPWVKDDYKSAADLFITKVEEGIVNRYGDDNEEAWARAETEMEVFLDAGLEHYFLQTWDFCQFCDDEGIIRGPGRGSAGGAIVSYALGITDIDPLRYGLIFERFYNPGREKGFPDIDNDFPKADRKRVRDYLKKRWGEENVKAIGTISRLKPKAALDKTYKACGITWDEKEAVKKFVETVPDIDILGSDSIGWSSDYDDGSKTIYVLDHIAEDLLSWLEEQDEDRHEVLDWWLHLVGVVCSRVSGYGIHASGIVVSDVPLNDELPCDMRGPSGEKVPATQFAMNDVDARQFVKQDLLGLRNLDTLQDWEATCGSIAWSGLEAEEHPTEMWEMLDKGLSLGIFQIEDGYARQLCKSFKPRSVEDLAIIVSLNRPGPIRSKAPDSFIKRRSGLENVSYDHEMLEDILEPTYGWFLYQEQVIAFFTKLGYSLSDADAVRKILGKKKPEDMIKLRNGAGEWENKGYLTMAQEAGIDSRSAQIIWDKIESFAKYSFNKSHAIAYATIAFRTLYAKYMDPAAFIISCIRTNPEDAGKYVSEARRMKIKVSAPDILKSDVDIRAFNDEIYFGFSNIKGIAKGSAKYLCELRDQFTITTPEELSTVIEKENIEWKAKSEEARKNGTKYLVRSPKSRFKTNQITVLETAGAFSEHIVSGKSVPQRQRDEKELLQVVLTDESHLIFNKHIDLVANTISHDEFNEGDIAKANVAGVITTIQPKTVKKTGKEMGIVTIEHDGGAIEFAVYSKQWAQYKFLWQEYNVGLFTLAKTDRGVHLQDAIQLT